MVFHNLIGSVTCKLVTYVLVVAMTTTSSIPIVRQVRAVADVYTALTQRLGDWRPAATSILDTITAALPASNEWQIADLPASASALPRARFSPSPLSISRLQSAYTPADALAGTLAITFTVSNNLPPTTRLQIATVPESLDADPNTIHDVLLVDDLTAYAAYVASDPRADYKDGTYTWNLGDIPPMKSLTAMLVLEVPASVSGIVNLDTGATAWGTLARRMVHAGACPATLAPASLAQYLRSTVDADLDDGYVSRRAGQLCPDPVGMFEYVRTLGYEAYTGSLRGARGTEWSQAGNSLDQANLLVAMLRGNSIPARYRHGTLADVRARELILSMFPTTGAVVGYVPDGTETADPGSDPDLLAEARDHWWVEAYLDGAWVAMDPSFRYAALGDTFATLLPPGEGPGDGGPFAQVPDEVRHKVTVTIEVERYDPLSYLSSGFTYHTPLAYTFATAELVGEPLTLEHLVAEQHPPMGYLIYGWTYYTYVPYLRLGDGLTIVEGHPFWELLSNFPFGQFAVTAEWIHFDVQDAEGNVTRYTRQVADRAKAGPQSGPLRSQSKQIIGLMTADPMSSLGPETPSLVHQMDSHTIYFNPSWMSKEYAAHVGEDLLVAVPRILRVESIAASLGDVGGAIEGGYNPKFGAVELAEAAEVVVGTAQALDRMLGASFVTMSDDAAQDLGATGLVKAYPDAPRITIASTVIQQSWVVSETTQTQILDLLYDGVRAIAYPGQAKGAERVYRMTRGVCDTFLESAVGEALTGGEGAQIRSAANVLRAAQAQSIPLAYIDANRLNVLARLPISTQARAFIVDTVQKGYGVLVPERMVAWEGEQAIAWWQLDLETGEMVGVGEDGTHQFLVQFVIEADFFAWVILTVRMLIARIILWFMTSYETWFCYWYEALPAQREKGAENPYAEALKEAKDYMNDIEKTVPSELR